MTGPYLFRADAGDEYYFQEGCHILERLNDAADPAASVARARVAPGTTTRWHRLEGTVERYLIVAGQGFAEIGADPGFEVVPGDVVLIPPGTRQRIRNTSGEDLVFLAICTPRFDPDNYREA